MLRITETGTPSTPLTLRLEGTIAGPWIEEIRRVCEPHLRTGRDLRLNLAGVTFVETTGLTLLQSLQARGVVLTECSLFVAEQLKAGLS